MLEILTSVSLAQQVVDPTVIKNKMWGPIVNVPFHVTALIGMLEGEWKASYPYSDLHLKEERFLACFSMVETP